MSNKKEEVREKIRRNYSDVAIKGTGGCCCGSSCCVIISNCVINLSLDKEQVFKEAYRVLKIGGRLKTSDVVAKGEIPDKIRTGLELVSGCIGGAESIDNMKRIMQNAGFQDVKLRQKHNSDEIINSWFPGKSMAIYVALYDIEAVK